MYPPGKVTAQHKSCSISLMSDSSVRFICLLHSGCLQCCLKVTSPQWWGGWSYAHCSLPPFVFFRWNTVMHSAVTHHSQWSGFFSPASDVVRAIWEEVCGGGASTWTTVCPGVLGLHSWGGETPAPKPQAEAGSWAVLAAERALVLPALQRG